MSEGPPFAEPGSGEHPEGDSQPRLGRDQGSGGGTSPLGPESPGGQGIPSAEELALADRKARRGSVVSFLKELPFLIITSVIIAYLIKTFLLQPFYIPTGSMQPTLLPGDHVLVNKVIYRLGSPQSGDVTVFKSPIDRRKDFIKRVIAVEGQEISVADGQVYINGVPQVEPYAVGGKNLQPESSSLVLKSDEVFVMGDNRSNSQDSRFFGPVAEDAIVGKAFVIYWPPSRIRILR